jgi:serine/threonine-protein kinase
VTLPVGAEVERYQVLSLIGAGAMGEVFLAVDVGLGRKVALKILSEVHRENPELRARFIREARAVAAVSHPNVVQVFTTGEFDGRPYFAMEYLAGKDLGSLVREGGPMSSRVAAGNLLDAARGLEAAANAGLIHRDVKPSNLVRLDTGPVKVTDFGLVKPAAPTDDPALTALGVVVGTPDYIAPEQARGESIDSRVDIYSLGCTLFYLVVGRPPFRRGNDDEDKYLKVVARHLREPAPDPRQLRPDVDGDLAELALAMMHKAPDQRPGYPEVIERLEEVRGRLVPRASSVARTARSAPPSSVEAPAQRRSSAWLIATTVFSVLVFFVGAGLNLLVPRPEPALAPGRDAGVPARPDAVPPPPDGAVALAIDAMLLVRDGAGRPLVHVDRNPVTNRAYAEVVKAHRYAPADADRPVTGVSFDEARNFAKTRGKRLLRPDEWEPALDTLGFIPAGMRTWEWIDDGRDDARDHAVRRVPDGAARRRATDDKDVTFRLARTPR